MKRKRTQDCDKSQQQSQGNDKDMEKKEELLDDTTLKGRNKRTLRSGSKTEQTSKEEDKAFSEVKSPGRIFEPKHRVSGPGKSVIKNCRSFRDESNSSLTVGTVFYSPRAFEQYYSKNVQAQPMKTGRPVRNRRPAKHEVTWSSQLEW